MHTVLVVYDGVIADECEAFRSVLGLMTNGRVTTVAAERRPHLGPGGQQSVGMTFAEAENEQVDVVIVPGGLGCERAADDQTLREFLRRMEHRVRYLAASSTGSVVLASAGVLHGGAAATHWLAGDLLRRYGSDADGRRLVVAGNVITCEGRISALDAAFAIVERIEGSAAVDRIRATLLERGQILLAPVPWYLRLTGRILGRATPRRPRSNASTDPAPPVTPFSVMIELVEDEQLARSLRKARRRHRTPGV